MKNKIVICTLVLMFSAFAGSALAGDGNTSYSAEEWTLTGNYNTFIGDGTGGTVNTGAQNTFVGDEAGSHNTSGYNNTFLGRWSGLGNTTGYGNAFVGNETGYAHVSGMANTFVGGKAGRSNTVSSANTFIGNSAGFNTNGTGLAGTLDSGNANTFLGALAGYTNSTGAGNNFMGYSAGYTNQTGSGNIFLGFNAGYYETGSYKLYIANSDTSTPLIYGEFNNSIVGINGKLGIGTQAPVRGVHLAGSNAVFRMDRSADTAAFQMVRTDGSGNPMKVFVVGTNASGTNNGEFIINDNGTALSGEVNRRMTISNTGTVTFPGDVYMHAHYNSSSLTLKDNVRTYENALDTVNRLRGVSFDWKDSGKPAVGLIAEEVAKVVPEVVAYNDGAAAGVNYASLVGVLVEAVKEQEVKLDKQEVLIKELQQRLIALEGK
jgi:hypothetical protein